MAAQDATTAPSTDETVSAPIEIEKEIKYRDKADRPVYKLSVKLIDTYKHINKVYYDAKAKRLKDQASVTREGVYNDGYDDCHYDYILHGDEIFFDRYILKHRVGKGSFGQVVCAYDKETQHEVAIKIIKSRKPFLVQAQTEISLLSMMLEKDGPESNIVKLLHKFVYRNHQCIVFEMLSYNLYDLLKNTRFKGVSLNLIRKFAKQILKSLEFLSSPEIDVIHCDLKPENILLRHPRRSAITIIDFGSSCLATKKTYTYIQSRFYRSPEVLLGLPYTQKIDMWSLGCILVEMHTGEPLFGGTDQQDQMCRITDVLGLPPLFMIEKATATAKEQFFEKVENSLDPSSNSSGDGTSVVAPSGSGSDAEVHSNGTIVPPSSSSVSYKMKRPTQTKSEMPKPRTLAEIIGVHIGGPFGRRKGEAGHAVENYEEFLDFVQMMLVFDPEQRVSPTEALKHPYLFSGPSESVVSSGAQASTQSTGAAAAVTAATTASDPMSNVAAVSNATAAAPSAVEGSNPSVPSVPSVPLAPAERTDSGPAPTSVTMETKIIGSSSISENAYAGKTTHKRAPVDPIGQLPVKYVSRSDIGNQSRVRSRSVPSSMRLRLRHPQGDIEEEQDRFEDDPVHDNLGLTSTAPSETNMQIDG